MNQNDTLLIEKLLDAPIEKVWQAWEDPEKLAEWWRLASVKKTVITEYDFHPGGTWRQHAISNQGFPLGEHNPGVEFKEIVPLQKIITVPKPIEGDSVEIMPYLVETVVTFERMNDTQTTVKVIAIRNANDDWQPNELQVSVYQEVFDNLAKFESQDS